MTRTMHRSAPAKADQNVDDSADYSAVWAALETLTDPEIPVLSLREMGILREVRPAPDGSSAIEIVITPTYSGCPAMGQIEDDLRAALVALRIEARIVVQWAPAWTTDWMSQAARDKLRAYGIAPPGGRAPVSSSLASHHARGAGGTQGAPTVHSIRLARKATRAMADPPLPCPRCGSTDTTEISHFGSTACKALFRCLACLEPFDHFKPH